ncbi:adrenodoxin-like protein 1, mitochondrial [Amborella trichopoda]|uniref:adrenodoxin-like protein 1, mitochondrial n=1 Tax=Amborella trichopoda TaxID=13333 RepID=UPI0005D45505|nr:adrenodoxin-like protein 1, mitochondrial [Amborella trichopoda]XP_020523243.1 adrenodoxin-like protein 1, mitochondrial [Amborella trichopoda]|eukprot:XP_011623574.1 adrenodoxin-like protein 1, mitochondrial [Amborella trichopoda]
MELKRMMEKGLLSSFSRSLHMLSKNIQGSLNLHLQPLGIFGRREYLSKAYFDGDKGWTSSGSIQGAALKSGKAELQTTGQRFSMLMESLKRRHFSTTGNGADDQKNEKEKISVTFVDKDGNEKEIKVPIGMSMLEAAHENDIDLEGACEGSLACSTCHVIVMDVDHYNKLEDPTDEENDMLDLAFGLTETSRLGCQVIAKPELDGIRLALPAATRNFAVDGYVPKPH